MKSLIFCIAIAASVLEGVDAKAAASYNGTWAFTMKVAQTSCLDLKVGDSKAIELLFVQSKKALSATQTIAGEPIVGSSVNYVGYVTNGGIIMSLGESCPVVPEPICATGSDSFTFLSSSKTSSRVVWLAITRKAKNELDCWTIYKGTAKKKRVSLLR